MEGSIAGVGAILALPLGWLPVTAGLVASNDHAADGSERAVSAAINLPTWEVLPILVAPMLLAGPLWTVVPGLRALLGPRTTDVVAPRA